MSNLSVVQNMNRIGLDFYQKQEYQKALKYFICVENLNRNEPSVHYNLSKCYLQLGQYKKAHSSACNALRLSPNNSKYSIALFSASIALGDLLSAKHALPHIKESVTQVVYNENKKKISKLNKYAKRLEGAKKCNDYEKIVYNCDKFLDSAIAATYYKVTKAEALIILGKYDDARILANSILLYEHKNVDALFVNATCTYYEGNIEKSIVLFKNILKLMPGHKKYMQMYSKITLMRDKKAAGRVAFNCNDLVGALNCYNEALKIDKYNSKINAQLNFNIALISMKRDQVMYAIDRATDAIKLDQAYLKALLLRAQCFMKMEFYAEALCDYKCAHELHQSPDIQELIEKANEALNQASSRDSYDILGIDRNANQNEIRKAYRSKALLYHPDRHRNCSQAYIHFLENKFKDVYTAYKVIMGRFSTKQKLAES